MCSQNKKKILTFQCNLKCKCLRKICFGVILCTDIFWVVLISHIFFEGKRLCDITFCDSITLVLITNNFQNFQGLTSVGTLTKSFFNLSRGSFFQFIGGTELSVSITILVLNYMSHQVACGLRCTPLCSLKRLFL